MARQASTTPNALFGPTYYLGLQSLIDRRRYRPRGFARPAVILLWLAGLALAWFLAEYYWPVERFNERHSTAGQFLSHDEAYAWLVIPFFIYTLPMFGFGYVTIKAARIQRPWINSLIHLTWATAFMAHAFYVHQAEWFPVAGAPAPSACVSAWSIPVIGFVVFYVADRYTRPLIRVFYPAGGGHWATEYQVFFNAEPTDVWDALEAGDVDFLKACRSEGPTRVSHEFLPRLPEQTTALIISTCPQVEGQKAYLFLKTYLGYRFSQLMVRATLLGVTLLRDVELTEGDLAKLSKMIPGFTRDLHTGARGNAYAPNERENFIGYSGPPADRADSPNGSWLAWVARDEIRSFSRPRHPFIMLFFVCLALAAIGVLLQPLTIYKDDYQLKGADLTTLIYILTFVILALREARRPRGPRRMGRAVASRRERLFVPDASAATVWVQPVESYGRFKLGSKEFALARVRPDGIDFEFGKFRARLMAADIQLDLVKTIDGAMLVLDARLKPGRWRVVVEDAAPRAAKDSAARAANLKSQWESAWAKMTA
ncbi:MAG: hypothetical protein ABFD69_06130 [Candidatus Sumerlaeia bacterium]